MARVEGLRVTGPGGVDRPCRDGVGAALSVAITFACRTAKAKEEASFYVRDARGNILGFAASEEDGCVYVRGSK